MFTSVVFTNKNAFIKASMAPNVLEIHEPFLMLIYEDLVQSTLDMRNVRYIAEAPEETIGLTGLAILTSTKDYYYSALDYLTKNGIIVKDKFEGTAMIIVEMPKMGDFTKFYNQLLATGFFYDIEQDITQHMELEDVQQYYPNYIYNQHGWLSAIQAAESLAVFNNIQSTVDVAIIDTKVDINNPDLVGRTSNNYDCVTNIAGADYSPDYYIANGISVPTYAKHGTPMAGIVAANSTNGILVQSHTRNKVKAQILRAFYPINDSPAFAVSSISIMTRAFNKAMENPRCAAISMSFGGQSGIFTSGTIQSLIGTAKTTARNCKGIPMFASAGNNNTTVTSYPAIMEDVVCVGGTSGNTIGSSVKASFANYGPAVYISAPAVNVLTTDASNTFGFTFSSPNDNSSMDVVYFNGTSASAPIVAGVAAVMVLVNPELTEDAIRRILRDTAEQVGGYTYDDGSEELGYGLVNMYNAVSEAVDYTEVPTITDYTVSITAPATAAAGENVEIDWTVDIDPGYSFPPYTNCPGTADLPKLTFYKSASADFLTSTAVPIGFITLDIEPADTTATGRFEYVIPCDATGTLYFFAMIDSTFVVDETDENNNMDSASTNVVGTFPECVVADLSVTVLSSTIASNGQRRVNLRFTNTGQATITTWNFTHGWLSNNNTPATVNVNFTLAPGQSRNISLFAIQSPQGLPNTFFAQINTVNGTFDSNLNNNYSSLLVTA